MEEAFQIVAGPKSLQPRTLAAESLRWSSHRRDNEPASRPGSGNKQAPRFGNGWLGFNGTIVADSHERLRG